MNVQYAEGLRKVAEGLLLIAAGIDTPAKAPKAEAATPKVEAPKAEPAKTEPAPVDFVALRKECLGLLKDAATKDKAAVTTILKSLGAPTPKQSEIKDENLADLKAKLQSLIAG